VEEPLEILDDWLCLSKQWVSGDMPHIGPALLGQNNSYIKIPTSRFTYLLHEKNNLTDRHLVITNVNKGIKGKILPVTGHGIPHADYMYSSTLSLVSAKNGSRCSTPHPGRIYPRE